ncbi:MAG: hypothetical protein O7G85_00400 [Planctomycetota bacterium]|nr:hypothetical protein [Planctomycetota bacterium]
MNHSKSFEAGLDPLFRLYTQRLRREAGKKSRGPLPKIDRWRLETRIERLVEIARDSELRAHGRATFDQAVLEKRQWHPKRGKGWGVDAKKQSFRSWYDKIIYGRNCVYVFWAKRKCLYVGRTGSGGRRPQAHFEKYWFRSVTRIDMYVVSGKRKLPMAECLAIDLFNPAKNKVRSAQQKWRRRCPVCTKEVQIRRKLKQLFPLRRKR